MGEGGGEGSGGGSGGEATARDAAIYELARYSCAV